MGSEYNSRKLHISGTIYYTQFVLGCVVNLISPLVIQFSQKFQTDIPAISVAFTITTICYMVAAITGGLIYNYVNRHACVLLLTLLISTAVYLLPHVTAIPLFYIMAGMIGFGAGGCDTAQITWIIETWRSKAAPFILFQHFSFSLGTIVPPLLLSPFLDQQKEVNVNDQQRDFNLTAIENVTEYSDLSTTPPEKEPNLLIPFSIAGSMMVLAFLLHCILFIRLRLTSDPASGQPYIDPISSEYKPLLKDENPQKSSVKISHEQPFRLNIVLLACCVIGFYQAMEVTIFQFLPTFCVYSEVGLSQAAAAQILFGLSLAFACGRGLGILLVLKIPPQFILWANLSVILIANIVLLLVGQGSVGMLQFGTILLGSCGMSTVYPAFYAYIERHLHITNRIVASITLSGGLVSSVYPLIVGNFVQEDPSVLNYVIFCSLTILVVAFGSVHWLTRDRRTIVIAIKNPF